MRFQRSQDGAAELSTNLRHLLQEIDAQWDALAHSIQEDRYMLRTIQQQSENLQLVFALDPEPPLRDYPAIVAYLNTSAHVMEQIQHTIRLKQEELKELERQFDQARLAGAAARQETHPDQSARGLVIKYFLINSLARPLRILWKIPYPPGRRYGYIANNTLLRSVQQQSKNREKEPSQS